MKRMENTIVSSYLHETASEIEELRRLCPEELCIALHFALICLMLKMRIFVENKEENKPFFAIFATYKRTSSNPEGGISCDIV